MSLQFATTSQGAPAYFAPTGLWARDLSPDYRRSSIAGVFSDAVRRIRKSSVQLTDPRLAQVVSLGFSEPVSGSSKAADFDAQLAVIERMKAAPVNWSMSEPEPPSDVQAVIARQALFSMAVVGIPAPRIMLLSEGVIGAYWRREGLYASIDFDEDGEFPWTAAVGDTVSSGIWVRGSAFPQELRAAVFA